MPISDLNIAFSGIVTFTDNTKTVLEAYYDRKGGSYSPDSLESLSTDQQLALHNSGVAGLYVFFQDVFASALGVVRSAAPDAPAVAKTPNGGVLHVRGMLAEDNNDKTPISFTYDVSQLDLAHPHGVSHVGATEQAKWDEEAWSVGSWQAIFEQTLQLAINNAQIAAV